MSLFSIEQISERMWFENPWWSSGKIEDYYNDMNRRLYFDLFKPLVLETSIKRALVLMGPRRVGKTVMMYHAIQDLLSAGVSKSKIAFISVETPIYNKIGLDELFKNARKSTNVLDPKGWFVFFDEIQYLKDWEVHLKVLVDDYPHTKFIVSGSAAAALKLKSNESGAGRFTDFMLPPLTFNEYLNLKNLENIIIPSNLNWNGNLQDFYATINIKELNSHFVDYINFGGYPEVIFSEKIQSNPGRYIRSDIVDKVLLRDLPSLYGIQDVQELNSLFTTLAYGSANEVSLDQLSKNSGVNKNTIKRYIDYLEAAFLIKKIKRVDETSKVFKRDNFFKVYLTNPSLRSALFTPLKAEDDHMGNMVETAIFSQWMHRDWFTPFYARWLNGEVDMIGIDEKKLKPNWALEIKWSNRYFENINELKSLRSYCEKNELNSALVTTIDKTAEIDYNGLKISFIPAALYAYAVGKNTLNIKLKKGN